MRGGISETWTCPWRNRYVTQGGRTHDVCLLGHITDRLRGERGGWSSLQSCPGGSRLPRGWRQLSHPWPRVYEMQKPSHKKEKKKKSEGKKKEHWNVPVLLGIITKNNNKNKVASGTFGVLRCLQFWVATAVTCRTHKQWHWPTRWDVRPANWGKSAPASGHCATAQQPPETPFLFRYFKLLF